MMARSEPSDFRRKMELAEGYLLLEMAGQAVRELESVRRAGQGDVEWHRLHGEALRMDHRHTEALESFHEVQRLHPDELTTLMAMAWCYKRVDRLPDAIEIMKRAYDEHPQVPVVLYNLACYYSLAGEKALALSWLGRAIRMDPDVRSLIPGETDFDPLRDDPDFQFIIHDPTGAAAD